MTNTNWNIGATGPGQELDRLRTKPTPDALWSASRKAWLSRFGTTPNRETLALLLAHWAFETGHGDSCWCWNLGNEKYPAKAPLGSVGDWQWYPAGECRKDGSTYTILPPNRGACWRAHETIDQGAQAHVELLWTRYQSVWPALLTGNPVLFCAELKRNGYFTAPIAQYTNGVAGCYRMYWRVPDMHGAPPTIRLGSKGSTVVRWQIIVGVKPDGIFGPNTERATREWQIANGLIPDGIVGPTTWRKANA